ncbi:MAG: ABC transporter ATP-binding protein/permease [Pseudomonadota bacterium]
MELSPHGPAPERGPSKRFFRDFIRLAGPYWSGPKQLRARLLTGLLGALVLAQVGLAIRLNIWSADLFDALERRSTDGAMAQIAIFVLILGGGMITNTLHLVVKRYLQLDWRRWLTGRLLTDWMEDSRHYQAVLVPGDHANPDGRIAEDVRIATEAAVDLASNLFYCVLLLTSFVGVLWSLSGWIQIGGVWIPGHLVALAIGYAALGSVTAFFLGRPLVRATDTRQSREADFRFGLVRAHENAESIAVARGEYSERDRLRAAFEPIAQSWRGQTVGLARLLAFSSGYVTLAAVFPILVGTPRFLEGTLTLGRLMQSAQAFQQVTAALSWPVDNLPRIAEWRASVERVLALAEAVQVVALEAAREGETAINLSRDPALPLAVRELWVAEPDGTELLTDLSLEVAPREHILVDGDPEATAALFRVFAGIWPWGRGWLNLPPDEQMMAVGPRIFLPEGRLRDALAFPASATRDSATGLPEALGLVGLAHLEERLDEVADWGRSLNYADMQRLSFARLLFHRPDWIILGNATDALEPAAADEMLRLLKEGLPQAAVILLGRHPGSAETFQRRMTLRKAEGGQVLLHEVYARRLKARLPATRTLGVIDWLRKGYGG